MANNAHKPPQAAHCQGTSKDAKKRRRKRLQALSEAGLAAPGAEPGPSAAHKHATVGPQSLAAAAAAVAASGPGIDVAQGGGDMGVWSQFKAFGGKVSCWDPCTGKPLFDVTPEEAAVGEAEAEAKASIGRVSSRQLGSQLDTSSGLQQVAQPLEKCIEIVRALDAERPLTGPFPVMVPIAHLLAKKLNSTSKEKAGAPSTSDLVFSLADSDALAELLAKLATMVKMYSFEGLLAHLVGAVQLLAQRILAAEDLREDICGSVPTATDDEMVHHLTQATEIVGGSQVYGVAPPLLEALWLLEQLTQA